MYWVCFDEGQRKLLTILLNQELTMLAVPPTHTETLAQVQALADNLGRQFEAQEKDEQEHAKFIERMMRDKEDV